MKNFTASQFFLFKCKHLTKSTGIFSDIKLNFNVLDLLRLKNILYNQIVPLLKKHSFSLNKEYLRSIIFGVEDSLVSTTGLIAGISVGSNNREFVLLAGIVAVSIEAVSMGAGEYLSDDAVQELEKIKRYRDRPLVSGFLMFVSYFTAGLVPLAPILLANYPTSLALGITFSLIGLFLLGFAKGKIMHTSPYKGGFKILIVGGLATILGLVIGFLFNI